MKKSLLVAALAAFTAVNAAQANFYVEGNLGYSNIKINIYEDGSVSKSKITPSLAVGYKFSDFRIALDYTHYGKLKENYNLHDVIGSHEFKINSLGFSTFYDINLQSNITPFIGARISLNKFKSEDNHIDYSDRTDVVEGSEVEKKTKFGYGVIAGVSYKLADRFSTQVAVEYQQLAKFEDTKIKQYGAKIGLRYEF